MACVVSEGLVQLVAQDEERGSAGSVVGGFVLGALLAYQTNKFHKADMRGWA